jgi:hypothetical protein
MKMKKESKETRRWGDKERGRWGEQGRAGKPQCPNQNDQSMTRPE